MNSFYYYNPTKLVFGKDAVSQLGQYIPKGIKKLMLHYGGGSIKRSGLYDEIMNILNDKDIEVIELSGVTPNPKLSLVRKGINLCKENSVEFILAVGGGSSIDSAKAIAAGANYDGDIWEMFLEGKEVSNALPIGVVLTIPASGSESSDATIISDEDTKTKKGLEHDLLRPQFAILNPKLTLSLPQNQTFAGVVDILSHVMERYFTNTEETYLTDELCEATMRTVISNGYRLLENPDNYDARSEIMLSGTMAHSGILGLGREEDWASHRIGHELSALYGTTHGVTLSIILPAWMKYVYKNNINRFKRFAVKVFNVDENMEDEDIALKGIEKFESFLTDINMPVRLSDANIDCDNLELMAAKCTENGPVGRFVKIGKEDVLNIFNLAK